MNYEVKEHGLGGILDNATVIFKDHLKLLLKISLCLSIPFGIFHVLLTLAFMPDLNAISKGQSVDSNAMLMLQLVNIIMGLITLLIIQPITNGATIYAISSEYLGKNVTTMESLSYAFRKLSKLLGTSIYAGILIILGFFLLIIPGIILAFRYWFTTHVVIVEDTGGGQALDRSAFLMKGNYVIAFILGLILIIIGLLINSISGLIPGLWFSSIIGVVIQSLLFIFGSAAGVVFYFSARCKNENFDLSILSSSIQQDA